MLFSSSVRAARVSGSYSLETNKVVVIAGGIDDAMVNSVYIQLAISKGLPGDRLVIIRSPGGSITSGRRIIKMLEEEKARTGKKLVCVVVGGAHSMAFSILTHCDVRLATPGSTSVVHKAAAYGLDEERQRMTAIQLRKIAEELDKSDREIAAENQAAMLLDPATYDKNANAEKEWTAKELLNLKYLHGIVRVGE